MLNYKCIILLLALLVGCVESKSSETGKKVIKNAIIQNSTSSQIQVKILGQGMALNRNYELIKITQEGMRDSYVQWFPPIHRPGPVIVYFQPYHGISWAQNKIDDELASRENAVKGYQSFDLNGPLYNSAVPNKIHYQLFSPEQVASEAAPYLLNNVGVLIVYGRFYVGGSISDTLQSVSLSFQFLSQQLSVDKNRIGLFGFSFGGFQALYGAVEAIKSDIIPKVGVAWAPLSDFELMDSYAKVEIPRLVADPANLVRYNEFFDPYLRRTYGTTGGSISDSSSANFSQFKGSFLVSNLKTPFLVIQNEWDTLIPIQGIQNISQTIPNLVKGLWFPQLTVADPAKMVLSHALTEDPKYLQASSLFTQSYLLTQLMNDEDSSRINIIYQSTSIKKFFEYLRTMQNQSKNIGMIKDQLLTLLNSKIIMNDIDHQMPKITGSEFVAWVLHIYWGIHLKTEDVSNYLKTNSLPKGFTNDGISYLNSGSTDSQIQFYPSTQHMFRTCANNGCQNTDTLFVFLPGSNGMATHFQKLIKVISDQGIPSISLQYENTNSLNSLCVSRTKTVVDQNQCFIQARNDRVEGATGSIFVSSPADGILPRLKKMLIKLHWYQFFKEDGSLNTEKIVFGGFSQGSGMASWIGKKYLVKRVCQMAGTWDYTNDFLGNANSLAPASWLSRPSQTPESNFYGFSHQNDSMENGIFYLNILWNQLGMVGKNPSNFIAPMNNPSGQKVFSSDSGGLCLKNSHSCTVADDETPVDSKTGNPIFQSAWKYTCLGISP